MRSLLAASLVITVIAAGVTPCAAATATKPVAKHDCCPPEASAATDAAAPRLAGVPGDCCLVMPAPQPAAKLPTVTPPAMSRDMVVAITPAPMPATASVAVMRAIGLHARSSPRPPLVTVLLI